VEVASNALTLAGSAKLRVVRKRGRPPKVAAGSAEQLVSLKTKSVAISSANCEKDSLSECNKYTIIIEQSSTCEILGGGTSVNLERNGDKLCCDEAQCSVNRDAKCDNEISSELKTSFSLRKRTAAKSTFSTKKRRLRGRYSWNSGCDDCKQIVTCKCRNVVFEKFMYVNCELGELICNFL